MTRQVVTEHDMWIAMYDYLIEQCNGYLKEKYPEQEDHIDDIIKMLSNKLLRMDQDCMEKRLNFAINVLTVSMTECMLDGCDEVDNHSFMREFINLVWDTRVLTVGWLNDNGTPVGFSVN